MIPARTLPRGGDSGVLYVAFLGVAVISHRGETFAQSRYYRTSKAVGATLGGRSASEVALAQEKQEESWRGIRKFMEICSRRAVRFGV